MNRSDSSQNLKSSEEQTLGVPFDFHVYYFVVRRAENLQQIAEGGVMERAALQALMH